MMKKLTTIFLLLLINATAFSQIHYTNGPIKIGIAVTKDGLTYSLDSLCSDYDSQGVPQNLVIPPGSSMVIANDSTGSNRVLKYQFATNAGVQGLGSAFSVSSDEGSVDTLILTGEDDNLLFNLIWKTDYSKPRLEALLPADQYGLVALSILNKMVTKPADTVYTDWHTKEYINSVDQYGIPINPVFPTDVNAFIFLPKVMSERGTAQLIGFDDIPYFLNRKRLSYRDLPPGSYEFVLKAFPGADENYTFRYPFKISTPWWMTIAGITGFVLLGLLMLGSILFLFYRRKVKIEKKTLEWQKQLAHSELKAIRSQLNPHFMFNALNAIQNLVAKGENSKANLYISKLSKLMRMVLEKSDSGFHDLHAEIENITHYLELENLRMPFQYNIHVSENVSKDTLIPSLLLQPYVENAVIHGIYGKENGKINIDISLENGMLVFDITDNGKGLSPNNVQNSGLNLSNTRVAFLNKIYAGNATVTVNNRKDESGVIVKISIPTEE